VWKSSKNILSVINKIFSNLKLIFWKCCYLPVGVALNVWFITKGMCAKNKTYYLGRTSNNRVFSSCDLFCCLPPQCEALRTCRPGMPIATKVNLSCKHIKTGTTRVKRQFLSENDLMNQDLYILYNLCKQHHHETWTLYAFVIGYTVNI